MPPPVGEEVKRVDFHILGKGNNPIAMGRLPLSVVAELPTMLDKARTINPTTSYQEVIRNIWDLGVRKLKGNLARGILADKS